MLSKGTYRFLEDSNFNFQLNRVVMWGNGDSTEIEAVAKEITDSASWIRALTKLAKNAEKVKKLMHKLDTCACRSFLCMTLTQ